MALRVAGLVGVAQYRPEAERLLAEAPAAGVRVAGIPNRGLDGDEREVAVTVTICAAGEERGLPLFAEGGGAVAGPAGRKTVVIQRSWGMRLPTAEQRLAMVRFVAQSLATANPEAGVVDVVAAEAVGTREGGDGAMSALMFTLRSPRALRPPEPVRELGRAQVRLGALFFGLTGGPSVGGS